MATEKTDMERLTILASRLIEAEDALHSSRTMDLLKANISSIKTILTLIDEKEMLKPFRHLSATVRNSLSRLETGDITKRDVSCAELYKTIIVYAVNKQN